MRVVAAGFKSDGCGSRMAELIVSTPESALGFSTVLLGSPNPRRAFCEFGRAEFLWHASGHLAEL